MSLFRYTAVPIQDGHGAMGGGEGGAAGGGPQHGELSAESAAALRASLRRIGLRVTDMREVRRPITLGPLAQVWSRHLRSRRQPMKAELFDSLATMLDAGLPIVEALSSLARSSRAKARNVLVMDLRELLRAGESIAVAAEAHQDWFDKAETAMLRVGEASGELPSVMRSLATRHQRGSELSAKLSGVLVYPAVVACVGLGVVVFLSAKTLPDLVAILDGAGIETPALTLGIMAFGDAVRRFGLVIVLVLVLVALTSVPTSRWFERHGVHVARGLERLTPTPFRRVALARAASALAELLGAGVTLVEALRITGPTLRSPAGAALGRTLTSIADRVEHGERFSTALQDSGQFDDEVCRLVEIGETSGELRDILSRLAERESRRADRAVDRLATLLEPAVILVLAVMVGLVVMGAILPMLRLQEVIG